MSYHTTYMQYLTFKLYTSTSYNIYTVFSLNKKSFPIFGWISLPVIGICKTTDIKKKILSYLQWGHKGGKWGINVNCIFIYVMSTLYLQRHVASSAEKDKAFVGNKSRKQSAVMFCNRSYHNKTMYRYLKKIKFIFLKLLEGKRNNCVLFIAYFNRL